MTGTEAATGRAGAADRALDVAIVGGGIAGLYAAWRLTQAAPELRLQVFEAGGAVGGRLRSLQFRGGGAPVELGAIAYAERHRHLAALVRHLALPTRRLRVGSGRTLVSLRGRTLASRRIRRWAPWPLFPFDVPRPVQAGDLAALVRAAAEAVVPGSSHFDAEGWRAVRREARFGGRPLRDWTIGAVLDAALGGEAAAFLEAALGYGFARSEVGAAQMLEMLVRDFGRPGPLHVLRDGYQALPVALAATLSRRDVLVRTGHRLTGLELPAEPGAALRLHFTAGDGATNDLLASRVVLALPPRAIASIPSFPAREMAPLQRLLNAVQPWPMGKIALLYTEPWWAALGVRFGRSMTDFPARQIWHEDRSELAAGIGGPATLVAHYDGEAVAFWRERAPAVDAEGFAWLPPDGPAVRELQAQLARVFGPKLGAAPPLPLAAGIQDWTVDAFGGGAHFWLPGQDSDTLGEVAAKPLPHHGLHLCGEAWSRRQGWVEGALESAERMLQTQFGLAPPTWLDQPPQQRLRSES